MGGTKARPDSANGHDDGAFWEQFFGSHPEEDGSWETISEIETRTGRSRQEVIAALKSALAVGQIERQRVCRGEGVLGQRLSLVAFRRRRDGKG